MQIHHRVQHRAERSNQPIRTLAQISAVVFFVSFLNSSRRMFGFHFLQFLHVFRPFCLSHITDGLNTQYVCVCVCAPTQETHTPTHVIYENLLLAWFIPYFTQRNKTKDRKLYLIPTLLAFSNDQSQSIQSIESIVIDPIPKPQASIPHPGSRLYSGHAKWVEHSENPGSLRTWTELKAKKMDHTGKKKTPTLLAFTSSGS